MAGDPESDEGDDAFVQDGPDLFGEQPAPSAEDAGDDPRDEDALEEPTPADDVDEADDGGERSDDDQEGGLLTGPETPEEPDGLESEEDQEVPSAPVAVEQIEAAVDLTQKDPGEPPLALYRRYRPETFDEVIGQEHVTEPLKRAIINNRVNHAYLFSGPRGCGKTTSARILARALNCEKGPTPNPCGVCQSCRDLARGGPGSIDVIEIDAASHGGVDDARDLRERAFFAPVASRYKIYIIDEAHMVTTQGFNALLKLVEEPPPHVKFIFATTEPEKVIGTIRSRTHHYPFRLVPPKILIGYLETICAKEGIHVDRAVLPLVVRAGGGSVRDSLSVLDQLLGGAEPEGVTYQRAAALLGYTPDALLDEIVDAFAAGDSHEVFATIDKVIEIGQDPRRFTEDLLRRIRDLVILSAVPDACSTGLIDASPEQAIRLSHQAAGMGAGELTRAAEVLATGLTQMRGTTAPRLHLELMCARVLLPASDAGERGYNARLERLERRVGIAELVAPDPSGEVPESVPSRPEVSGSVPEYSQSGSGQSGSGRSEVAPDHTRQGAPVAPAQTAPQDAPSGPPAQEMAPHMPPQGTDAVQAGQQPAQTPQPRTQQRPGAAGRRRPRPSERNYSSAGGSQPPSQRPSSAAPGGPQVPAGGAEPPVEPGASSTGAGRFGSAQGSPAQGGQQGPSGQQGTSRQQGPSGPQGAGDSGPGRSGSGQSDPARVDISMVRREWPRVLEVVKSRGRMIWMVLSQYAQVLEVHGREVTIGFANPGARDMFVSGPHAQVIHDAVMEVLGADLSVVPVLTDAPSGPVGSQQPNQDPGYSPGREPSQDRPPDPTEPGRDGAVRPGGDEPDGRRRPDGPTGFDGPGQVDEVTQSGYAAGSGDVPPAAGQPDRSVRSDGGAPVEGADGPGVTARGGDVRSGGVQNDAESGSVQNDAESGSVQNDARPDGVSEAAVAMTHRWSERAKESIRATSRPAAEPEPEDEEVPPEDWDSEVVDTPQVSAADLIRSELGGVVITTGLPQ
ncbi:DNA polymerase III subunit gamma and tau [Acidipropionibacterium jensenii]|uniref:DNA-directed DNA polymerase n=1 Tax=Acidipropionibacterium jensenii TaxID=1749 RepID=A0A3T0S3C9_9ACTN|nr:DNA polymerase III subunit gamma and tau [Acidipropionibacterium jensenii]AZZ40867.1 DNA polymerase III subunit gamma and tau [Acidipropionibacterium jensenii]